MLRSSVKRLKPGMMGLDSGGAAPFQLGAMGQAVAPPMGQAMAPMAMEGFGLPTPLQPQAMPAATLPTMGTIPAVTHVPGHGAGCCVLGKFESLYVTLECAENDMQH